MSLSRTDRIINRIEALARISAQEDGLTRTFCSEEAHKANACVIAWAEAAGLTASIDNVGNVRIRQSSYDPAGKTFVIGSHLDSVINAGKYDGPLGFLIGLDILSELNRQEVSLPFNLEVVGFSDEEGVRYHTTYLGSSVLAGVFEKEWLGKTDAAGISMQTAIESFGGSCEKLKEDAIPPEQFLGYYEVHIEQGPRLETAEVPIGLVSGIAGQVRAEVRFIGQAGHAGTVPMEHRYDALVAAADYIRRVEKYAHGRNHLVATVGKCEVRPNASNVIPSEVVLSLDIRSVEPIILKNARLSLQNMAGQVAEKRRLGHTFELIQENAPVACHPELCEQLTTAIEAADFPIVSLSSGAGHDAVALSKSAPVSMLFVRCRGGISHHPDEYVAPEDITAALTVSDLYIQHIIDSHALA